MKNLICQESKKNREILSHITLRQYFTQSLCHLKFRSYTSFKTNVVACHITTEHSSKSPNWQQICFQNLFLLPMIIMVAAWSAEIKSCNLLLLIFCWFQLIKLKKKRQSYIESFASLINFENCPHGLKHHTRKVFKWSFQLSEKHWSLQMDLIGPKYLQSFIKSDFTFQRWRYPVNESLWFWCSFCWLTIH